MSVQKKRKGTNHSTEYDVFVQESDAIASEVIFICVSTGKLAFPKETRMKGGFVAEEGRGQRCPSMQANKSQP